MAQGIRVNGRSPFAVQSGGAGLSDPDDAIEMGDEVDAGVRRGQAVEDRLRGVRRGDIDAPQPSAPGATGSASSGDPLRAMVLGLRRQRSTPFSRVIFSLPAIRIGKRRIPISLTPLTAGLLVTLVVASGLLGDLTRVSEARDHLQALANEAALAGASSQGTRKQSHEAAAKVFASAGTPQSPVVSEPEGATREFRINDTTSVEVTAPYSDVTTDSRGWKPSHTVEVRVTANVPLTLARCLGIPSVPLTCRAVATHPGYGVRAILASNGGGAGILPRRG